MSEWKSGMSFESILQTPLDFYDVTYANGHTIRYEIRQRGNWIWKSYDMKHDCGDIVCSKCSCVTHEGVPAERLKGKLWDYCPACGSDNRKKSPCDHCIDDSDCDRCDVPRERR